MSIHSFYRAIHEESPLFLRLRVDGPFHLLFAQLTILGAGPFCWSDLEADEVEDVLDAMTAGGVFPSRAQADRVLAEIEAEVGRAIALDPKIADRSAYIEQVHRELEEALLAELERRVQGDRRDLVETLLWGDRPVGPAETPGPDMPSFRYVPASIAAEGAAMLVPIEAADLYPRDRWDRYPAEEYHHWRWLYGEAASLHAAVLVLSA